MVSERTIISLCRVPQLNYKNYIFLNKLIMSYHIASSYILSVSYPSASSSTLPSCPIPFLNVNLSYPSLFPLPYHFVLLYPFLKPFYLPPPQYPTTTLKPLFSFLVSTGIPSLMHLKIESKDAHTRKNMAMFLSFWIFVTLFSMIYFFPVPSIYL